MNELNLKQVRNALEHCINNALCDGCPIGVSKCHIIEDSLSLINELTEENKAWQMQLIDTEEKAGKAYYELACEVEDLRAENEGLRDFTKKQFKSAWTVREDTVRKMQERLKYTLCINNEENTEFFDYVYTLETIDQIAKELLEDTK